MIREGEILDIKLRKNEDRLKMSGWGAILVAVWPIIDIIMNVFLMPKNLDAMVASYDLGPELKTAYILVMLAFLIVQLIFFVLAGRAALGAGKRTKKTAPCLVLSIILLVLVAISFYLNLMEMGADIIRTTDVIYLILDGISILIILQMLICVCKVRSLRKKLNMEY